MKVICLKGKTIRDNWLKKDKDRLKKSDVKYDIVIFYVRFINFLELFGDHYRLGSFLKQKKQ